MTIEISGVAPRVVQKLRRVSKSPSKEILDRFAPDRVITTIVVRIVDLAMVNNKVVPTCCNTRECDAISLEIIQVIRLEILKPLAPFDVKVWNLIDCRYNESGGLSTLRVIVESCGRSRLKKAAGSERREVSNAIRFSGTHRHERSYRDDAVLTRAA